MVDGLLVALALLNAYIVALFVLHRRGKLQGPVFEAMGPILLVRTERGKRLIDWVSRPRRLWKGYGDAGVVLAIVSGFLMFGVLVSQLLILASRPDVLRQAAVGPEFLLVLPGINPLIPLWYGLLGLIVALVVHEGAHGVLARAHDIKVKSLGLLVLVVPIGAFVEPDDEELEKAPTRVKNRVFAAGIMTNLAVAVLAAALFSGAFWGAVQPATEGLVISNVLPGQGAENAGLQAGMVITAMDGRPVRAFEDFNRTLAAKHAGDAVLVRLYHQGSSLERNVQLTDKYAYYAQYDPELNDEGFRGQGFLGVSTFPMTLMRQLRDVSAAPLDHGLGGFGLFLLLPFPAFGGAGLSPLPQAFEGLFTVQGPLAALPAPAFWMLANSLYWVFWLNLMVGTFNALPLSILDGGQMYKASLRGLLRRWFRVPRERLVTERILGGKVVITRGTDSATQEQVERIDALVRKTTLATALVIVTLILIPLVAPRLL